MFVSACHIISLLTPRQSATAKEGRQRADRLFLRGQRHFQAGRLFQHLPHLLLQVHKCCQGTTMNANPLHELYNNPHKIQ